MAFYDMDEAIYQGLWIGCLIMHLTKNRERNDETKESMRYVTLRLRNGIFTDNQAFLVAFIHGPCLLETHGGRQSVPRIV